MSYKKTVAVAVLLMMLSVQPARATNDAGMTTLRGAVNAQQLLEYLQMFLSYKQDLDRMQTMGESSDVKNEKSGDLGQTVKSEDAKPVVLEDLKSAASRGSEGRKEVYEKTDKLLKVDMSSPESFQKAKEASNAMLHIAAVDAYSKALQVKASATSDGIEQIDNEAKKAQNFQEKSSAFMLYIPPIARKLNSINRLDAQINTLESAQKMPTLVGESMPTNPLSTQQTSAQGGNS